MHAEDRAFGPGGDEGVRAGLDVRRVIVRVSSAREGKSAHLIGTLGLSESRKVVDCTIPFPEPIEESWGDSEKAAVWVRACAARV